MTKVTKAQREMLIRARDNGNAWYYRREDGSTMAFPWSASRDKMERKMIVAGLLTRESKITEAGLAALV